MDGDDVWLFVAVVVQIKSAVLLNELVRGVLVVAATLSLSPLPVAELTLADLLLDLIREQFVLI